MPIEGVVADANVLLSAVVGKAALRVFTEFNVTVHVAQFNTDEVAEYLPHMARKYGLNANTITITIHEHDFHGNPEFSTVLRVDPIGQAGGHSRGIMLALGLMPGDE